MRTGKKVRENMKKIRELILEFLQLDLKKYAVMGDSETGLLVCLVKKHDVLDYINNSYHEYLEEFNSFEFDEDIYMIVSLSVDDDKNIVANYVSMCYNEDEVRAVLDFERDNISFNTFIDTLMSLDDVKYSFIVQMVNYLHKLDNVQLDVIVKFINAMIGISMRNDNDNRGD